MKRLLLIAAGAILVLVIAAVYVLRPAEFEPAGDESVRWSARGSHGVLDLPFVAIDEARPTAANGDYPGAPTRRLAGRIWSPDAPVPGASPIVLYSHGFMSSHAEGEYLGRFLASHGYTTVAVDYPLSNGSAPGGPLVVDVINQPEDLSFVLDQLLGRNATPGDVLYQTLDPDRVVAVGLSLGGLTTELAAFHPELGDSRIKAAVSIAGPTANLTRRFFEWRNLPFLMLAGELDAIVPYAENALPILQKAPGATLVTLEAASHTGFAAMAAGPFRFVNHPDEMVCGMLMQNLANGGERPLFLDDPEVGIVGRSDAVPCSMTTFERAMRPPEQIAYMRLVVFSFLESVLATSPARRTDAASFLHGQLQQENPKVRVVTSP
ncbi:MAG: alpha/beta hydrolase family protein [Pseudomonadota bacterium]